MNLYKPELMKIRLSAYLRAILGILAGLLSIGMVFLFINQIEGGGGTAEDAELFSSWNGLTALTTALAFACFSVFSAVIAARVIVSEYCGRNAVVLLSYPVGRKAILQAKCLTLSGITTVSAFISNMLVIGVMYLSSRVFGIRPQMNTKYFFLTVLLSSLLMGVLSSGAGMISAAFGYKKRSSSAAVVCSLIIVCALANCITIAPKRIVPVMLVLSGSFVIFAGLIYHTLAKAIEQMEV